MSECPRCRKPLTVCVCDRAAPVVTQTRVLILQHPEEQDVLLSTAPLVAQVVRAQVVHGVMWRSPAQVLGATEDLASWGVLYPHFLPRPPGDAPYQVLSPSGAPSGRVLTGLIALDGTWDQARTLWLQNPWLQACSRVLLQPSEPSIYGKLRREPHKGGVSTLEAIALALSGNGEPPAAAENLRRAMRTLVQRVRDASKPAPREASPRPAPRPAPITTTSAEAPPTESRAVTPPVAPVAPRPVPAPPKPLLQHAPASLLAVCTAGLEEVCAQELAALGYPGQVEPQGVSFEGDDRALLRSVLWLRTASRVLRKVAQFEASSFAALEGQAKRIPWAEYIAPGRAVSFRVRCERSRLYHTGAIEERLREAVARAVPHTTAPAQPGDDEEESDAQLIEVRFLHDQCALYVDAAGAPLHLRGYRQQTGKAPLRETLAAALLLACGWDGSAPLLDPMCGAGTIVIEAALLARRIAPGLATESPRRYAFQQWPAHDPARWEALCTEAREQARPAAGVAIFGSDHMEGAIRATQGNAARARVLNDLSLAVCPLASLSRPPKAGRGWLITNPPYGVRVGERASLGSLYGELGRALRGPLAGWRAGVVTADAQFLQRSPRPWEERLHTRNGGLHVRLFTS